MEPSSDAEAAAGGGPAEQPSSGPALHAVEAEQDAMEPAVTGDEQISTEAEEVQGELAPDPAVTEADQEPEAEDERGEGHAGANPEASEEADIATTAVSTGPSKQDQAAPADPAASESAGLEQPEELELAFSPVAATAGVQDSREMGELEGLGPAEAEDQLPDDQLFSETTVQDGMVPGLQFSEEDAGDALPAEEADVKSEETETPAEAAVTVKDEIALGEGEPEAGELFFARAPIQSDEQAVRAVFTPYGEVRKAVIFKDSRAGVSKGCGLVTMATKEAAEAAMTAIDGKLQMPGWEQAAKVDGLQGSFAPMVVKWSKGKPTPITPVAGANKRKGGPEDADQTNTQVFIAKIPGALKEIDVEPVFAQLGTVVSVVLFRASPQDVFNKGCGIVSMSTHEEAALAIQRLDRQQRFPGSDQPMVVKWVDQQLQKRHRQGPMGAPLAGPAVMSPMRPAATRPEPVGERPPIGCDADTMKLFVGHISPHMVREDLDPILDQYGQVIEFILFPDKAPGSQKKNAFLWYKARAQAEAALKQMNNRIVDTSPGARPLSVVRARKKVVGPDAGYGAPAGRGGPGRMQARPPPGARGPRPQVYGPGPGARPPAYMSAQNPRPMTPQQQGGYGRGAHYQQPQQPAPAARPSGPVQQGYQMAMQPQQGYAPQQPAYAQPAYAQPGTQTGYAQAPGQPVGGYAVQQPQQVAQQAVMQSYAPQPLQAAGAQYGQPQQQAYMPAVQQQYTQAPQQMQAAPAMQQPQQQQAYQQQAYQPAQQMQAGAYGAQQPGAYAAQQQPAQMVSAAFGAQPGLNAVQQAHNLLQSLQQPQQDVKPQYFQTATGTYQL